MPDLRRAIALTTALALAPLAPAGAQNAHPPEIPPVLEITGAISGGVGGVHAVTPADLAAMEQVEFTTTLPYFDDVQTLTGVDALSVLDAAGPQDDGFLMTALDGYELDAPRAMLEAHRGLFVTALNGESLDPETFGPFWLAFDLDAIEDPDEREEYEAIAVYAIDRITVQPFDD